MEAHMSTREFYLEHLKAEAPKFVSVIRALPAERSDYRPHPRSRSAGELAWFLADSAKGASALVDKHRTEFKDPKVEGSLSAAADALERAQQDLLKRLAKVDDKAWEQEAEFRMDGKVAWKAPLGMMLWGLLFDAVHHRGQLSAYIRPMGGKVPSIYGPSADDTGN
jgi:uncharacterized damage-inducible protein DinB